MTDQKLNQSRRSFVKRSAAVSTAAAVGPWIVSSKVLASSGEVNVLLWSDYCPPGFLTSFKEKTGCGVLINTSFNVRGEPIVCTPEDAYRCFMRTEMDYLVVENFLMEKSQQPEIEKDDSWMAEFELD